MTEANSGPAAAGAGVPAAPERLVARQYRLLRELGRGGTGVVWLADDELLTRQVAVKELRPPPGLTDRDVARLWERAVREARNAARIRHPNAVTMYNVIPPSSADDAAYLIMEFVDGPTLADLIERHGPLPAPWVEAIGLQLLDVLGTAHAFGIVHRDVKPGNILLTQDGQAKLTDFGIAHFIGDLRLTTDGVVGTRAYLAPELQRPGPITPAADLWSLGATLFHAAEGRSPFERKSAFATAYAILFDSLPTPRCAPGVAAAISIMLRRDPAERATIEQARALLLGHGRPKLPVPGPSPALVPGPRPAVSGPSPAVSGPEVGGPPTAPAGSPLSAFGGTPATVTSPAAVVAGPPPPPYSLSSPDSPSPSYSPSPDASSSPNSSSPGSAASPLQPSASPSAPSSGWHPPRRGRFSRFGQREVAAAVAGLVAAGGVTAALVAMQPPATPVEPLPGAPQHLTVVNGSGKVTLSWDAVQVPGVKVWYLVYHRDVTTGGANAEWSGDACPGTTNSPCPVEDSTTDEPAFLTNGDHYQYYVAATDAAGQSAASNIVDAYPAAT